MTTDKPDPQALLAAWPDAAVLTTLLKRLEHDRANGFGTTVIGVVDLRSVLAVLAQADQWRAVVEENKRLREEVLEARDGHYPGYRRDHALRAAAEARVAALERENEQVVLRLEVAQSAAKKLLDDAQVVNKLLLGRVQDFEARVAALEQERGVLREALAASEEVREVYGDLMRKYRTALELIVWRHDTPTEDAKIPEMYRAAMTSEHPAYEIAKVALAASPTQAQANGPAAPREGSRG